MHAEAWHFNCSLPTVMAQDFEQLVKDLLGDSWNKLTRFQTDQVRKLNARLGDVAREALKDELTKLHTEVAELRQRVATLEAERAQAAADSLEASF